MTDTYRRLNPTLHIVYWDREGRAVGYWSYYGDPDEEPNFITRFDDWFLWALRKAHVRTGIPIVTYCLDWNVPQPFVDQLSEKFAAKLESYCLHGRWP